MELTVTVGGNAKAPLLAGSSIVTEMSQRASSATLVYRGTSAFRIAVSKIGVDTFGFELQEVDTVSVQDASANKHFEGFVTNVSRARRGPNLFEITATCQDYVWLLSAVRFTKSYTAQSDRAIYQDILSTVGLTANITATDANVDIVESSLTIDFEDSSARDAFDKIADLTGAEWRLDFEGPPVNLHYNAEANVPAAAFDLSDDPDLATTFPYLIDSFSYNRDFTEPINRVKVLGNWDSAGNRIEVTRNDTASQAKYAGKGPGGTGIFERTVVDMSITTTALANLTGDTILARSGLPEQVVSLEQTRDGLGVNEKIEITSAKHGLVAQTFLVRRLTINQTGGGNTRYGIECGTYSPSMDRLLRILEKQSRERTGTPRAVPPVGSITETMITDGAVTTPKVFANAIVSDKLDATEIKVGGGGSKPGKFGVYSSGGAQIGFIGVEGGFSGGWFKELRVGGASAASAPFVADSGGNVTLASVTVTSAASVDGGALDVATVNSDKLNTTEIKVGGGGSKPGKFSVYNSGGTQIGFIGVEGGFSGGWFKELRVGGAAVGSAVLVSDSSGNVSITGGTFELTSGSNEFKINGTEGFWQKNTSTKRKVQILDGSITIDSDNVSQKGSLFFEGQGDPFIEGDESTNGTSAFEINSSGGGSFQSGAGQLLLFNAGFERLRLSCLTSDNPIIRFQNDSGTEALTLSTDGVMGNADSGYIDVQNGSGASKVELGVDGSGDGVIHVGGNLVLTNRQTGPAAISGTAGASYTSTEQTMINDLKAQLNVLRTALNASGHGLVTTV